MAENDWEVYLDKDLGIDAEAEFINDRLTEGILENEDETFLGSAKKLIGVAYGERRIRRQSYTTESRSEEKRKPSYEDMTDMIIDNYRDLEDIIETRVETDTEEFYDELEDFVSERLKRKLEESEFNFATAL